MRVIKFKLDEGVQLPEYQTEGAVGFDVQAIGIITAYKGDTKVSDEKLAKMQEGFTNRGYIKMRGFERILFDTGLTFAGFDNNDKVTWDELQVRSRSGMTLKKGLIVLNAPGTIDPDYRGRIGVILYNSSPHLTQINYKDRIAQLVYNTVLKGEIQAVKSVEETTERGAGGFGSTGE